MPSPFPGMDPWLESDAVFPDLHATLTTYLREAVNAKLPAGYFATTRNLVWIDDTQRREPDVSLFERGQPPKRNGTAVATLPGLAELGEEREMEPWEEPYLEIVSAEGERLVTAIEILSPANKASGSNGRQAYRDKHEEFRLGNVNLVEIDLLRSGLHSTAVPRTRLQRIAKEFSYHISVMLAGNRYRYFGTVWQLADRLPTIGIPLDPGIEPVTLDLQPLLDRAYDTGRYAMRTNYTRPPDPPLTPEQQAWADAIFKAKGA